jgi:hypothetical protein
MSGWLVGLIAFYAVWVAEMIHALHVAPEHDETTSELDYAPTAD